MNIKSINNSFIQNNIQLNNFSKTNNLPKMGVDTISFTSRAEEVKVAMQARLYMTHAIDEHKEAYEISQDAFRVYQASKDFLTDIERMKEKAKEIYREGMKCPFDAQGDSALIQDEKGRVLQEVYDTDNNQVVFAQYDKKHNPIYEAFLGEDYLVVFKKNEETGDLDSFSFDRETGELFQFATGIEFKTSGYEADCEVYIFDDEITYSLDVDVKSGKYTKADEKFTFKNGTLTEYNADINKREEDGYSASGARYVFEKRRLTNAMLTYEQMEGQYRNADREYVYGSDGCMAWTLRNVSWNDILNNKESKEKFEFNDNGLKHVYIANFENLKTKKATSKQLFEYANDRAVTCRINHQSEPGKSPKCDRAVSIYF